MKYSCSINGYTSLNLTKLDILDDLPEILVGVKYMVSGTELDGFPGALDRLMVDFLIMERL
jgi:adenylosuccinate synthase